jgi:hypothetical protein
MSDHPACERPTRRAPPESSLALRQWESGDGERGVFRGDMKRGQGRGLAGPVRVEYVDLR